MFKYVVGVVLAVQFLASASAQLSGGGGGSPECVKAVTFNYSDSGHTIDSGCLRDCTEVFGYCDYSGGGNRRECILYVTTTTCREGYKILDEDNNIVCVIQIPSTYVTLSTTAPSAFGSCPGDPTVP